MVYNFLGVLRRWIPRTEFVSSKSGVPLRRSVKRFAQEVIPRNYPRRNSCQHATLRSLRGNLFHSLLYCCNGYV